MRIVKLDIVDNEVFDGSPVLETYYLIDPDKEKLRQLKHMVENRLDYEYDDTLSEEEYSYAEERANNPWEFIDLFIAMNFKTLDIDELFEINY